MHIVLSIIILFRALYHKWAFFSFFIIYEIIKYYKLLCDSPYIIMIDYIETVASIEMLGFLG